MKLIKITLGIIVLTLSAADLGLSQPCPISQSVYRDVEGKGFELVFGEPIPEAVTSKATAMITHPQEGQLYYFDLGQSQGYGSIWMGLMAQDSPFNLNFFDKNLVSANPVWFEADIEAPKYLFITGLGSHDYYYRRSRVYINPIQVPAPLLGDMMWVYHRCQI